MKKKILLDRLILDKETILKLDEQQLKAVVGGFGSRFSCVKDEFDDAGIDSCCKQSCASHLV